MGVRTGQFRQGAALLALARQLVDNTGIETRQTVILPLMDFDNDSDEQHKLETELTRLRVEHGDLNDAISALEKVGGTDQLQIQRFKRRKLLLKDQISKLEDRLTPDIIA
jgi:hypothetical protein